MSNERDHWSIGEVLALLQDEFPEITISKIRFLESQGLVSPERTPSGYRRFYDEDYDRLYWILKQQRDHYLPLRVIRDRLDGGVAISPAPRREMTLTPRRTDAAGGGQEPSSGGDEGVEAEATAPDHDGDEDAARDPAIEVVGAEGPDNGAVADEGQTGFEDDPGENIAESDEASSESADSGLTGQEDVELSDHSDSDHSDSEQVEQVTANERAAPGNGTASPPAEPQVEAVPKEPETPVNPAARASGRRDSDAAALTGTQNSATVSAYLRAAGVRGYAETEPEPSSGAASPAAPSRGSTTGGAGPVRVPTEPAPAPVAPVDAAPAVPASIPGSSVALTREQLADQAGCTFGMVTDLEKYGMIVGHHIGGSVLFDSTALTITRLAIEFNRYGIEPRHLKTFRLGAEREVELLAQGIGPTLRANNADTRRRSFETLNDLAELGASLRRILVRDLVAQHAPEG